MNLKEYIEKFNINPVEFAVECGLCVATIYKCMNGTRPHMETAIRIEMATRRKVTVKDLRGIKKEREENDSDSGNSANQTSENRIYKTDRSDRIEEQ